MSKQLDPLGKTAPELPSIGSYRKFYSNREPWNEQWWGKKCLPFSDNMPALCYAHGISWKELTSSFPGVFSPRFFYDSIKGKSWPDFEIFLSQDFFNNYPTDIVNEINDKSRWNLFEEITNELLWMGKTNDHDYTISDQIDFIKREKIRQPKKILEIGGGVGVLANTIKRLDIECISVDIAADQKMLYDITSKYYFGIDYSDVTMKSNCISLEIHNIDLSEIDTIVLVESIEHIPEERFDIVWNEIIQKFKGRFIVTNWLSYHPIVKSGIEHCRRIDDQFYDFLSKHASSCWYRNGSHLVLDFQ
jgi:hypothetical protein